MKSLVGASLLLLLQFLIFLLRIKARTRLVHRVAELVVAQDTSAGIVALELTQEVEEGTTLGVGAGVGRMAVFVQTALVADADALVVPAGGMGAYLMHGAAGMNLAVAGNVEVIAYAGKAAVQMGTAQGFDGKRTVATGGAAMDDQETDLPVVLVETAWNHFFWY